MTITTPDLPPPSSPSSSTESPLWIVALALMAVVAIKIFVLSITGHWSWTSII